jgi:MFS family permease
MISKNKTFFILCLIGFFAILSSTMSKSPVLPTFATYLQTPVGFWTGVVASASTIPGILISLPAGSLSDILGRRKVLLFSSLIFASAPFLYLLINSWWQLIFVRFYHGFATGIFVPVAQAFVAEIFPNRRGERISLFSSITVVGRNIAPILGGYILLITNNDFHSLYLAVGIAGATALITALVFIRKKKITTRNQQNLNSKSIIYRWKEIAKAPGMLITSFVEASQYYVYGSVEFFLVKYSGEIAGLNSFLQGVIIAGSLFTFMFFKPFWGRISDKVGRRKPILLGCLISAIPLIAIPFFTQFPFLLFFAIVYGLGFSMVTSSTPALASELVSMEFVGSAMGFLGTIMDVGQTIGPLVCGLILETNLGYFGLFFSLALALFLSSTSFAFSKTGRK